MKAVFVVVALFACAVFAQEQPPNPPFLEGAPPATVAEFHKLLADSAGLTDKEIDSKVEKWVEGQSAGIKTKFVAFKGELKKHQSNAEAAHKAAIEKFSPGAKEADGKLSSIAADPKLSAKAKGEQIEAVLKALPEETRKEIEAAMQGPQ